MATTFQDFVTQERERLAKAREDALAKRKQADAELEAIEAELRGIAAYEAAKAGKAPAADTEKKRRGPAPGTSRTPRGEYDTKVIEIINTHPDGIARGDIMKQLGGAKVDNVLQRLKKEKKIGSVGEGKSSKYVPA